MAQGRINFTVGFNVDQSGLQSLKSSLASLQNVKLGSNATTQMKENLKTAQTEAEKVQAALQKAFNPTLNTYNIDVFKQKLKESGSSIEQVGTAFNKAGAQGTIAFRNLASAITSTKLPLQETHNLLRSMGTTLMNTIKWSVASNAINTVTGSVQKAWNFTKQLDESLNNIMIVTDKSAASMEQFARQANKAAKELGKSTTDYTNAALIFYQQGLSDTEVAARTETTLKAANVTGQSTSAVSEQLTAVWNGYKVSANEAELYVDKLSAVAATTAADLEELSTGMSKVASAANNMGVDIDQLNAQLATVISVTRQAPESVGTAFKTIFARISDIEAGLDTETTLGEYTSQMAEIGINVLDANNHLRDMGDVVEEIGLKWNNLSREQQISLAQTMAGTRQYNNLLALFDNWSMYESAMKTSINAAGTLQKQQDIYMESMEAHLEKLETAGERVYDALLDPDNINPLIDALTEAVDLFGSFVESIGGGGTLLMALVPVMTNLFSGTIANGVATFVTNLANASNTAQTLRSVLKNIDEIKTKGLDKYTGSVTKLREELVLLKQQGIITNEQFNELTESFDAYAEIANKFNLKKAELQKTEGSYDALVNNNLFQGINFGEKIDFEQLASVGKMGVDQGKSVEDILLEQTDFDTNYQRATENLELMNSKIDTLKENNTQAVASAKKLADAFQTGTEKLDQSNQKIIGLKNNYEALKDTSKTLSASGIILNRDKQSIEQLNHEIEELLSKNELLETDAEEISQKITKLNNITNRYLNKTQTQIQETDSGVKQITGGTLPRMEAELEHLQTVANNTMGREWLELRINGFIKMTSNISMAVTAMRMLGSLGDIWSNEDLDLNEKILQSIQNITSALTMITPIALSIVALRSKNAAATTAEAAAQSHKMAVDILELKTRKEATREMQEQQFWTSTLELAKDQLTEAQYKSIAAMLAENKTLDDNTKKKLANAAADELRARKSGNTTHRINRDIGADVTADQYENLANHFADENKKPKVPKAETFKSFKSGFSNTASNMKGIKGIAGAKAAATSGKASAVSGGASSGAAGIGSALAAALPFAITLAAIVAAIGISWTVISKKNNEEKKSWENAQKAADSMRNTLNEVNQEYKNLQSSLDTLASSRETLDDLTEGTVEWKKAITDVNAQVMELLKQYPELAGYIERDKNGALSISQAGQDLVLEKQLAEVNRTQGASILADRRARDAEIEYLKNEWAEAEVYGSQNAADGAVGGAIATAGVLAGAGAVIGTVIPGLGNIVGAAVGGAIGLVTGLATSFAASYWMEQEEESVKGSLEDQEDFDDAMRAFSIHGEAIFDSETALAEALDIEVYELTEVQKALVKNAEETKKLAAIMAQEKAAQYQEMVELGRSLGYDNEAEAYLAGLQASKDAEKEYYSAVEVEQRLEKEYGSDDAGDKAIAEYYAKLANINYHSISTKGSNKITYKDASGNEIGNYSMAELYELFGPLLAIEDAKSKTYDTAILSAYGTEDVQTALTRVLGDSEEHFNSLNEIQLQTLKSAQLDYNKLAKTFGRDAKELEEDIKKAIQATENNWSNFMSNWTNEAQIAFNGLISQLGLSYDQASGFGELLENIMSRYGADRGMELLNIVNGLTSDTQKKALIEALDSVDWASVNYKNIAGEVSTLLASNNINLDSYNENKLVELLKLSTGKSLGKEDLQNLYQNNQSLIDKIKKGNDLTKEEFNSLSKDVQKFFTENADGTASLWGKYIPDVINAIQGTEESEEEITLENSLADIDAATAAVNEAKSLWADAKNEVRNSEWVTERTDPELAAEYTKLNAENDYNTTFAAQMKANGLSIADLKNAIKWVEPTKGKQGTPGKTYNDFVAAIEGKTEDEIGTIFLEYYNKRGTSKSINGLSFGEDLQSVLDLSNQAVQNGLAAYKEKYEQYITLKNDVDLGENSSFVENIRNKEDELNAQKEKLQTIIDAQVSRLKTENDLTELESLLAESGIELSRKQKREAKDVLEKEYVKFIQENSSFSDEFKALLQYNYSDELIDAMFSLEQLNLSIDAQTTSLDKLRKSYELLDDSMKAARMSEEIEQLNNLIVSLRKAQQIENTIYQTTALSQSNKLSKAWNDNEKYDADFRHAALEAEKAVSASELTEEHILELQSAFLKETHDDDTVSAFNQYITTLKNWLVSDEQKKAQIAEEIQTALNKNLEKFELELQVNINTQEIQKAFNDFKRTFLKENAFDDIAKTYIADFDTGLKAFDVYKTGLSELNAKERVTDTIFEELEKYVGTNVDFSSAENYRPDLYQYLEKSDEGLWKIQSNIISQAGYKASKEELVNNLIATSTDLLETRNELEENYLSYQEAVNAAYDKSIELIEAANSALDHQKTMLELMYGDKAASKLESYYSSQVDNLKKISEQRNAQYTQDKVDFEAMYNADGSIKADYTEAQIESITSQYLTSADAYFQSINDLAIARQEQYLNTTETLLTTFDERITNMMGSVNAKEEWDWMQAKADDYLNSLDTAFGIEQVITNYNKAANSTTDIRVQSKINDLKEQEVKILREKDKLSQYDLDRAQKQLDVLQARIALEDAQQNKSQMRLIRGANGAYSYQYVADQNAIDEAREKLNKAQQDLVDLDEEQLKSNVEKVYDIYEEMMSKIREIIENGGDADAIQTAFDQYLPRIQGLGEGVSDIMDNIQASVEGAKGLLGADESINQIFPWLDSQWMDTVMTNTEQGWTSAFNEIIEDLKEETSDYDADIKTIYGDNGAIFNQLLSDFNTNNNKAQSIQQNTINTLNTLSSTMELSRTAIETLTTVLQDKVVPATENAAKSNLGVDTSNKTSWTMKLGDQEWQVSLTPMATGGYTGEWGPEGKLAVLHEKELVLNKQDTANILSAVDLVRSLGNSMMNTMAFMSSGYAMSAAAWELAKELIIEQTVHINAEFPNATDRAEIEAAFEELVGLATQHAYENKRG